MTKALFLLDDVISSMENTIEQQERCNLTDLQRTKNPDSINLTTSKEQQLPNGSKNTIHDKTKKIKNTSVLKKSKSSKKYSANNNSSTSSAVSNFSKTHQRQVSRSINYAEKIQSVDQFNSKIYSKNNNRIYRSKSYDKEEPGYKSHTLASQYKYLNKKPSNNIKENENKLPFIPSGSTNTCHHIGIITQQKQHQIYLESENLQADKGAHDYLNISPRQIRKAVHNIEKEIIYCRSQNKKVK